MRHGPLTNVVSKSPVVTDIRAWPKSIVKPCRVNMKPDLKVLKLVKRVRAAGQRPGVAVAELEEHHGLTREQLIKAYRTMYLSRRLDDKEIQLKDQNRDLLPNQWRRTRSRVDCRRDGRCDPGYDWFYPYYRDRALCRSWV